jgi:outer membrane receptor protein involved in Fe transport
MILRVFRILIVAVLISSNISAQNPERKSNQNGSAPAGKISGYLIDAQTNQIIEYGNIVLFLSKDSSMVNGTITDNRGKFILENLPFGMYYIKASFIGYATRFLDSIRVNPKSLEVDLGKILLDEQSIELGNVIVTGQKEMIINNLDKKIINVEKDLTSTGGSAVDVVGNIPSITVDLDGNVSFRGNQNIIILIDGKPSALVGASNSDILNSIPASSIESIELVTNPSARYDPDGSSGILNIILKKRIDGGLNGAVSLNAGTGDKYNGSINLNFRTPYVNFFSSFDSRLMNNDNYGNSFRTNEIQNSTSFLEQSNEGVFKFRSYNVNAGLDYLYDNYNTLTFSYRFRKFGVDSEGMVKNNNLDSSYSTTNYFERSSFADRNMGGSNYTLSYRRTFETKGQELTADVILGDFAMDRDEEITQTNFDLNLFPTNNELQRGLSSNSNQQWTIQSNYINPIEGFGRIETGFKVSLKDLNSKNEYEYFDDVSSIWTGDPLQKTDFDYKEQIYAVYGIYSNNINKFQYQIGLRAEQANVDGSEAVTLTSFNKNYFAIYPTIHLVQVLPDEQEVQLSYSRRVERPNNRQLNPYVDKSDSLNIRFGNPALDPEFVNSIDLGYSKFFGKTALTSSIFYKLTNDAINSITFLRDDGVTQTTWLNIANSSSYGFELTAAHPLFDWFRLNGSASYFYTRFEEQELVRKDNSWIAKLSGTILFSKDFNIQMNANYNSPILTAQGKINEVFTTDFAAKKDFMDGQLSITFRVSDIFNTRDMESETNGFNFYSTSYRKMESRVAYLGISYRLSPGNGNKDRNKKQPTDDGMDEF